MAFERRLKRMQEQWDAGTPEWGSNVEDGVYLMQLEDATLTESMSSGRLQIARRHIILEGQFQGEVVRDYQQLETENGPYFIRQWIQKMGWTPPEDVGRLEPILEEMTAAGPIYRARVQTSKEGFTNVRVLRLEEQYPQGAPEVARVERRTEPEPEPEPEEDEPEEDEPDRTAARKRVPATGAARRLAKKEDIDLAEVEGSGSDGRIVKADVEAEIEARDAEEPADEEGDDADLRAELLAFCAAQELDVTDDMDLEEVVEEVMAFEWFKDELLPDEIKLLEEIGAELVSE